MAKSKVDFLAILRTLTEHRVDFIVIGGVSAVLHGAPISTFDLDIVHSRKPRNVRRLLKALETLDAYYRESGDRRLRPQLSHLSSDGHQLLATQFGLFDLLGTVSGDRSYEDLLPHTVELEVEGLRLHLLDLPTLISLKQQAGRAKDKAVIPILQETLKIQQERAKQKSDEKSRREK